MILSGSAFAQAAQITITTDKQSYATDDIITISGTLSSPGASNSGIIQVFSPSNTLVQIGTFTVSPDGKYSTTIKAEGSSWTSDGSYTIKVLYVSPPVTAVASQNILFKIAQQSTAQPPQQSSQTTQQGINQTTQDADQEKSALEKKIQDRIALANKLKETLNQNASQPSSQDIPFWVKDSARRWHDGTIDNTGFGKSIQYMVSSGLVKTDVQISPTDSLDQIPSWVKKVAGWWSEGTIQDYDYINSIQYLLDDRIIK
jgi:hypothetical protein